MKFLNPMCPRCLSSAGIEMKGCKDNVIAIWCNGCQLTSLLYAHNEEQCPDCRADRNNHIDGCEAAV